jgi:hypothetical protein
MLPNPNFEVPHDGEFIVSDFGRFSYETGNVDASVDLRSGTVLKLVAGVYTPMVTGDTRDLVAGILRHFVRGEGANAVRPASVLARMAEVTDQASRMIYPSGGADAAHVATDVAECQAGLRRLFIINR